MKWYVQNSGSFCFLFFTHRRDRGLILTILLTEFSSICAFGSSKDGVIQNNKYLPHISVSNTIDSELYNFTKLS